MLACVKCELNKLFVRLWLAKSQANYYQYTALIILTASLGLGPRLPRGYSRMPL